MKKIAILIVIILLSINSPYVFANSAESSILIDSARGRVLSEKNAYEKLGPASCTKILTAIIALENSNLTDIVTASTKAAYTEGTSIYLKIGEQRTMEELLYALLLESGNDAATAIAEHISTTTEKFSDLMNKTTQKIGVQNTHFTNPHGLSDNNHYTTAYDLAQITRYALRNETFAKIVSTKTKSIPMQGETWSRRLTNNNKMLTMYEGCNGVKTGFTKATGRTLVTSATRNGLQLIAVTLNASDDWDDHTEMFDYGFANYKKVCLLTKDTHIPSHVMPDSIKNLEIIIAEDLSCALREEEEALVTYEYEIPNKLPKRFKNGNTIGIVKVKVKNEVIGQTNLIGKTNIGQKDTFKKNYSKLWLMLTP